MRRPCHNFPSADRFYLSVFCFFVVCKNDCDIIISVKSLVLIISMDDADCRAISQAALSQGCRTVIACSASEASLHLEKERPLLSFCDASLADGGGMFRALGAAFRQADACVTLIVRPDIKPGLLKALRPWVHDYLTTPVLREAAAARIKNALRVQELGLVSDRAAAGLKEWLSGMESVIRHFEPLSFDRAKAQDDLAGRIVRGNSNDPNKPAHLVIATPDRQKNLHCVIYHSTVSGVERTGASSKIPESAVFLRMKAEDAPYSRNYYDKGVHLADFQALFPPGLLEATGMIYNLAAYVHAGTYVMAFNYGRPVAPEDALFLKGLALPGRFLGAVTEDMRDVSESFLVMAQALALATDSHGDNGAHVRRMNEYSRILAEHMSLPARFIRTISYSAQLHDVGKIYIHPDLLDKPLRLTAHEFALVKKHPVLGANILGDSPLLRVARNIALTHHECWDGSGYPSGLSGNAIPLEGAIVKVADVYDALRTMRSYKSPSSHDDACGVIMNGGGDGLHEIRPCHFHPDALRAFHAAAGKFDDIYQSTTS